MEVLLGVCLYWIEVVSMPIFPLCIYFSVAHACSLLLIPAEWVVFRDSRLRRDDPYLIFCFFFFFLTCSLIPLQSGFLFSHFPMSISPLSLFHMNPLSPVPDIASYCVLVCVLYIQCCVHICGPMCVIFCMELCVCWCMVAAAASVDWNSEYDKSVWVSLRLCSRAVATADATHLLWCYMLVSPSNPLKHVPRSWKCKKKSIKKAANCSFWSCQSKMYKSLWLHL